MESRNRLFLILVKMLGKPVGESAYIDVIKNPQIPKIVPIITMELMFGDLGGKNDAKLRKWIAAVKNLLSKLPRESLEIISQKKELVPSEFDAVILKYSDGRVFKNMEVIKLLKNAININNQIITEAEYEMESRRESTIPFQGNQINPDQFYMKTHSPPFARVSRTAPQYGAVPTEPNYLPPNPVHGMQPRKLYGPVDNPRYKGYIYPNSRVPTYRF